jgi:hypothetical protein
MTWFALIIGILFVVLVGYPIGIFDVLIEAIGYTVARSVIPFLSFRRVYVQSLNSTQKTFNALGYRRDGVGRIEIEQSVAGFLGIIIFVAVFAAVGLLIHAFA